MGKGCPLAGEKENPKDKEKVVIVVEYNPQAKIILRRALGNLTGNSDSIRFLKNIFDAIEEMKAVSASGKVPDLLVTDIFFSEEINIFRLIREMEETPVLWNTPVLVFTNEADERMFNRIRKDAVHIPLRIAPKTNDSAAIAKICRGLLDFKEENRYFLEVEASINSYVEQGRVSLVDAAIKKIDKYANKYTLAFPPAKVNLLKGEVCFGMWKKKRDEYDSLAEEMEKNPNSSGGKGWEKKLEEVAADMERLISDAEKYFLEAHGAYPRFWAVTYSLYTLYMEQRKIKQAKGYLVELIEIFPEQTEYYHRMGKLNELEGDYTSAVKNYLAAARNAWEEGIAGYDLGEIMDIVNRSIDSTKKMLKKMGLAKISMKEHEVGSEEFLIMNVLKKNNAQIRGALVQMTKKIPDDAELFNKIGITYRRTGNGNLAAEMYKKAVLLAPENHRIRINYSAALALCGSWGLAKKEAETAKGLDKEREDDASIDALLDVISSEDMDALEKILV